MRVIAGKLGGRQFRAPKSFKTHPMSEKMRGALFNTLGDINGLSVLDAYGGSGALTFEAISRGASQAIICEVDRQAGQVILKNIASLKLADQIKLIRQNCAIWVENNPKEFFDLVICDPPYNDIKQSQLTKLSQNVKPQGLLILSLPPEYLIPAYEGYKIELQKNYGDSALIIYRRLK